MQELKKNLAKPKKGFPTKKKVIAFSENGKREFASMNKCAKAIGCTPQEISRACSLGYAVRGYKVALA